MLVEKSFNSPSGDECIGHPTFVSSGFQTNADGIEAIFADSGLNISPFTSSGEMSWRSFSKTFAFWTHSRFRCFWIE
jgi:hypothetical protein